MMTQLLAHLWGDFIFQSDWMAQNKTKRSWPAFVHALLYSLCFLPLLWVGMHSLGVHRGPAPENCDAWVDDATGTESICSRELMGASLSEDHPHKRGHVAGDIVTLPPTFEPGSFRWLPWLVIFGTHFLIDRYRLARYVVWAKNWMGPKKKWFRKIGGGIPCWTDAVAESPDAVFLPDGYNAVYAPVPPLWACPTGYPPSTPAWLSTWLLIITDNTLHLTINYLALRYL